MRENLENWTGRKSKASMSFIDKVAWIHIVNRELLAARSRGAGLFYIPGGKPERDESDSQALVREIKEELSIDLDPDHLTYSKILRSSSRRQGPGHNGSCRLL